MEELEKHLKEEIRLREKADKRLKFLMKKLQVIKGSRSFEGSEQLSSSEVSCVSSVSTSASKEEEETQKNGAVEEDKKTDQATEASVVASTTSHEEEPQSSIDFSWFSDTAQETRIKNQ